MKKIIRKYLPSLLIMACTWLAASAQPGTTSFPAPKHEILLLGTFHFNYPGLDQHNAADRFKIDILSDERQKQVQLLTQQLAAFRPTLVLIEAGMPDKQGYIDSIYRDYQKGGFRKSRHEGLQIGFRLADQLKHDRVYTIDANPFNIHLSKQDSAVAGKYATYNHKDYPMWDSLYGAWNKEKDSLSFHRTLQDYFLWANSDEEIRKSHNQYLRYLRKGTAMEPVGADGFISKWYNRNLRIFSNVLRMTGDKPERIVVIFGGGHMPILHHLFSNSLEFKVRRVDEFIR